MFSYLYNLSFSLKGPAAVAPTGLDPFSDALTGFTQSGSATVYLALAQMSAAIGVLGLVLFLWRKLASLWEDWNGTAATVAKLILVIAGGASAAWAYRSYSEAAHLNELVLTAGAVFGLSGAWWIALKTGLTFIKPRERIAKGSVEASVEEVAKLVKRDGPSRLTLAGVPIPQKSEAVHFMALGATGAGKSVGIGQLLEKIYADGDTIIMVDSGGDFASKYFDPARDFILNPFDDRTVSWNLMAEMDGPYDAESLAKSIIPEGVGDSKEWNSYAQTFLSACLTVLKTRPSAVITDLLYLAQQASLDELRDVLRGTAAYSQLESDKMFTSIRVIVNNYLSAYSYLRGDGSAGFSIKRFIQAEKPGALFVTYRDDQLDMLRNLISCSLDVASRTVLSLAPSNNRRVWLIVDEFASIGKVQSIEAFATKARKAGGCLVVGLQSISQLRDKYGEHQAQSIMSCLGTWLVLRCADADTADYMSRFLGEQTVVRHTEGASDGRGGSSKSVNEQVSTQRTVLPSELQELAPLHGFMRVAGGYPICAIELSVKHSRKPRVAGFIPKDFSKQSATTRAPSMATLPATHFQPALVSEPARAATLPLDGAIPYYTETAPKGVEGAAREASGEQPRVAAPPALSEISLPDATDRYIQELLAQLG